MLASRFHRPMPILAGIFVAVVVNHLVSAALGYFIGMRLEGPWLKWVIAASFFAVALWAMFPEKDEGESVRDTGRFGVFGVTVCAFFVAELGDKTEVATAALAARFAMLLPVVAGTTLAMLAANLPAVLLGRQLARWVSLKALRWGAVLLSVALGVWTVLTG
jgi:Ca2+/H+ antiporter, TMEM165/GDT1 family